jgi:hypothetical protein
VGGTQRIKNYTLHLKDVLEFPDAPLPIPYVDLLTCSVPTYHRGKASRHARENLASATSGVMPTRPSGPYHGKEEFTLSSVSSDDPDSELPAALEAVDLEFDQVRTAPSVGGQSAVRPLLSTMCFFTYLPAHNSPRACGMVNQEGNLIASTAM